jgi:hypothetical protein
MKVAIFTAWQTFVDGGSAWWRSCNNLWTFVVSVGGTDVWTWMDGRSGTTSLSSLWNTSCKPKYVAMFSELSGHGLGAVTRVAGLSDDKEGGGGATGTNCPGPLLRCIYFCLSRHYHHLSIVQINPFSGSHPGTECSRFSVKIFSRSALAGRWFRKFFHPGPNTLSAALAGRAHGNWHSIVSVC